VKFALEAVQSGLNVPSLRFSENGVEGFEVGSVEGHQDGGGAAVLDCLEDEPAGLAEISEVPGVGGEVDADEPAGGAFRGDRPQDVPRLGCEAEFVEGSGLEHGAFEEVRVAPRHHIGDGEALDPTALGLVGLVEELELPLLLEVIGIDVGQIDRGFGGLVVLEAAFSGLSTEGV
jgi:hypothetical protein